MLASARSTLREPDKKGVVVGGDSTTGRMPGRRSSTVGSRRVRFGFRARTRKRRCTILAATYVDLDLTDSSNPIEPTLKGGLQVKGDAVKEVISIKIFLGGYQCPIE